MRFALAVAAAVAVNAVILLAVWAFERVARLARAPVVVALFVAIDDETGIAGIEQLASAAAPEPVEVIGPEHPEFRRILIVDTLTSSGSMRLEDVDVRSGAATVVHDGVRSRLRVLFVRSRGLDSHRWENR